MHRQTLLIIDDDPAICRYLRRRLAPRGYEIAAVPADRLLAGIDKLRPDLILLATDPATEPGRELIQLVRSRLSVPLIVLPPAQNSQEIIAALDAGADDCVAKPFSLAELEARIKKLLRRDMMERGATPALSIDGLHIDLVFRHVYRCGCACHLSRRRGNFFSFWSKRMAACLPMVICSAVFGVLSDVIG